MTAWEAYERVSGPIGPERLDHLVALLCSVVANANRGSGTAAYRQEQFLPTWGVAEPEQPMTGDDMLRAIKRINRSMGGG